MTSKAGFLVSAAIHSALAVAAITYLHEPATTPAAADKRLTMSLAMFEPPAQQTPAPTPVVKRVIPDIKPAPLPEPIEPMIQPPPEPVAQPVDPFSSEEPAEPIQAAPPPAPVESSHMAHIPAHEDHQRKYISQVISAVEKNKFYPMAARRRGLTGEARITLNINEDGSLEDLQVECSHPMLAKAAEDAVRNSCPLPRPTDSTMCPMCLVFKMKFALD